MSTIWQPNTPANVDEDLNDSAPKINSNFNTIGNAFEQDHAPLGSTTNVGQHEQSTYITQNPVPTQDPNNIRLFSQLVSAIPQVFFQYPSSTTFSTPLQLTNNCVPTVFTTPSLIQTEVSLVLKGIIIKIGTLNFSAPPTSISIAFGASSLGPATPFPTSLFFLAVMQGGSGSIPVYNTSLSSVNGFTFSTGGAGVYMYIACGN